MTHTYADINTKSSRILEGNTINTDVTSPGAIVALSLMYLRSGNAEIARRIAVPHTFMHVEAMRPDLFFFRVMGQCLIMWDEVRPEVGWLQAFVPMVCIHMLV